MAFDGNAASAALASFDNAATRSTVIFSQQAAKHQSSGAPVIVTFPAGGRGYISHPQLWYQDAVFLVPVGGPYLMSVSFVKNPFGPGGTAAGGDTKDDVFAEVWRQGAAGASAMLMRAWSGATVEIARSTAAVTMVVDLKRGDELVLKANSDGTPPRPRDMREVAWTFHSL